VTVSKLGRTKIPGLLFADDLVAMTPSRSAMDRMVLHLQGWMEEHEMAVGIHKCGVMPWGRARSDGCGTTRADGRRWGGLVSLS